MNEQRKLISVPSTPAAPPGNTPSWFTPLRWWERLEERLTLEGVLTGPFLFDPCGHSEAPVSREIASRAGGAVVTAELDGLGPAPWLGPAWVNPPYRADGIDSWCERARRESLRRHSGIVLLVPAWTDRGWWHRHIEPDRLSGRAQVEFIKGRLTFGWPGNADARDADGAKFANALVIWGESSCP